MRCGYWTKGTIQGSKHRSSPGKSQYNVFLYPGSIQDKSCESKICIGRNRTKEKQEATFAIQENHHLDQCYRLNICATLWHICVYLGMAGVLHIPHALPRMTQTSSPLAAHVSQRTPGS